MGWSRNGLGNAEAIDYSKVKTIWTCFGIQRERAALNSDKSWFDLDERNL
jgi:hypothetical protein